jgi:hypothetical protein
MVYRIKYYRQAIEDAKRLVVYKGKAEKTDMTEEERKRELLSLAGCWADDPEDAALMEDAIKVGRNNEYMREINLDD